MENGLPTQREIKNEIHSSYIISMHGFIHVFSFMHEHFFIQNTQDKKACACLLLSHVQLSAIPWTVAHQAPLSLGFPRQEYWSGLPFPTPRIILTQGLNSRLLHWQADSLSHQGNSQFYRVLSKNCEIRTFFLLPHLRKLSSEMR